MAKVIRSGTGIILAGGKSRRFGTDKALAPWDGKTMVERVLSILEGLFPHVIVVTRRPSRLCHLGGGRVRVVRDLFRESHALGGIYSGLFWTRTRHAFVCGCDMPLLVPGLVRELWRRRFGYAAVVPRHGGQLQPLCAVYARCCLGPIRKLISGRRLRAQGLFGEIGALVLSERLVRRVDRKGLSFLDVDTPQDYRRVRAAIRETAQDVS